MVDFETFRCLAIYMILHHYIETSIVRIAFHHRVGACLLLFHSSSVSSFYNFLGKSEHRSCHVILVNTTIEMVVKFVSLAKYHHKYSIFGIFYIFLHIIYFPYIFSSLNFSNLDVDTRWILL